MTGRLEKRVKSNILQLILNPRVS